MSFDDTELLRRARSLRAFDRGETTTVLRADGSALQFEGDSAHLVRELLRVLVRPTRLADVRAHLDQLAGGGAEAARPVIDEALRLLREAGAIVGGAPPVGAPAPRRGRVVLGISGAVAAAHAPSLVDRLLRRGFEVRVAMTRAASKFVRAEPLRALTHSPVATRMGSDNADAPAPHIDLAHWAEVVLVAPASATTLARLAHGDFSCVVSALALTTRAPVVVAPSMNPGMYRAPAVERNLQQLIDDGFHLTHPSLGVEVADAPDARRPTFGSWPGPEALVAMVEHVWQRSRPPAATPETWAKLYADAPDEKLAFHTDTLDTDIANLLEAVPLAGKLWDLGTGLGTVALAAAELGFQVTATDVAPQAISRAMERADRLPDRAVGQSIRFLVDDVCASALEGTFDVVVDRGCLHTLDRVGAAAYAEAVTRRTRHGSLLVVKVHSAQEPRDWHTTRYDLPAMEALLGPAFELLGFTATDMPGRDKPAPRAWLAVFRRRP